MIIIPQIKIIKQINLTIEKKNKKPKKVKSFSITFFFSPPPPMLILLSYISTSSPHFCNVLFLPHFNCTSGRKYFCVHHNPLLVSPSGRLLSNHASLFLAYLFLSHSFTLNISRSHTFNLH